MTFIQQARPALTIFLFLSVLTGIVYPLGMTGIAGLIMPEKAKGSLILEGNTTIGSRLIGQNFTRADYFHGRPSATVGAAPSDPTKMVATPYNAAASMGSNLGPTSKALIDRVTASVASLKAENPDAIASGQRVPMDLVTTSASGLDPDISPEAAFFQVARIARARHLTEDQLRQLIEQNVQRPLMGWLGEPHINVLELNRALDGIKPA